MNYQMLVTALFLIATTFSAKAEDSVDPKGAKNSFVTLKQAFDSAEPAVMSEYPWVKDFRRPDFGMKCISTEAQRPDNLTPVAVGQWQYTSRPGEPDNGPLFPPVSEIRTTTLIIPVDCKKQCPQSNQELRRAMSLDIYLLPEIVPSPTGELKVVSYDKSSASSSKRAHWQAFFRKKGSELYFRYFYWSPASETIVVDYYGYCYRKD